MKVYISGPMKGRHNLNEEAFANYAELLREHGHIPVNPHDIAVTRFRKETDDAYYERCLAADFLELRMCDAIIMMPDWVDSQGARREQQYAVDHKIKIAYNISDLDGMKGRSSR